MSTRPDDDPTATTPRRTPPVPDPRPLQPLLHDSVVLLAAPSQAWSADDGDAGTRAIHGFYHSDVRVLDRLALTVGGAGLEAIGHALVDAGTATFTSLARAVDDHTADPRVRVVRRRVVEPGALREDVTLENALDGPLVTTLELVARADLSPMHLVKAGLPGGAGQARPDVVVRDGAAHVDGGGVRATLNAPGARVEATGPDVVVRWDVTVPAHGTARVGWRLDATDDDAVVGPDPAAADAWDDARVTGGDPRLAAWVDAALRDLRGLRMVTVDRPADVFLAAGAPWFFTLFGRDSLWAARMLLPFGTEIAAGTLRVLAGLQGTRDDAATGEQPGKVMHELRPRTQTIPGEGVTLPPLYYGTVDATALWIVLLHDAWRWGLPDAEVEALLPHLEAALAWMRDHGDCDGDGFLEYVDTTGQALANQGWKDSGDSIQWRDGTLAEGPIALCEVQGYAYEAAVGGAALLERFGRPGAAAWREWATLLKERFAAAFWVDDPAGPYPAVALDVHKRRVDSLTSNIGHLLGTGILDPDDARLVAARLASPPLAGGYGLRTLSSDDAGFWPLSYHGGSVWAHDTAIAVTGLRREGFVDEAARLARGLVDAAEAFGYRMPELHAGDARTDVPEPLPYPAACRPQAWSATASAAVLGTLLGLDVDGAGELVADPVGGVGGRTG
ncbi:amylo-alpha-1,6-glucosidase [Luteimicrobium album]|uniref:Amylo-alpha-1,6-glucosidase n=1 Tax=Luteimicrobium album TaxID=1054550 RepID=A0ABQ6HX52_9MICO|nr:glycogen debranching N-terminal domain-containing protein [Luteimicrobium album]GMA23095.1 amylo-alpha-1,6-glucosidase [Luteimicrobium album]